MKKTIRNIAVFCVLILTVLPAGKHIFGQAQVDDVENRVLAGWPHWQDSRGDMRDFTRKLDDYLGDHFGYRNVAIRTHAKLLEKLKSNSGDTVAGSSPNWLFLSHSLVWLSYQGRSDFDRQDVDAYMNALVKMKRQSGNFAAIIAPDKARIYPEHAPQKYGKPSAHRFISFLYDHERRGEAGLLNVEPAILRRKMNTPVYYKTDTHWTNYGAYEAYRLVMEQFTGFPVLKRDQLVQGEIQEFSGDLARLRGLAGEMNEKLAGITAPAPRLARTMTWLDDDSKIKTWRTSVNTNDKADGTVLVIIGDSFSNVFMPFFAHSFDKIIFVHHKNGAFDFQAVLAYEPDAVLFAPVERFALILAGGMSID